MKILIAEDEPAMRRIIRLYLEKEGYEVSEASDGQAALDLLCRETYDLLIADWMMPRMDGIQLCREVRACSMPIKIIILTARSEARHEIEGLTCGADDYIRKPFEPGVLLLRIKKMFRLEDTLCCGSLTLNPSHQTAFMDSREIRLTQKEYQLLLLLMRNQGITLSRDTLVSRIWGNDYDGDERTLDTHIRRIRSKIGKEYISTYVGLGYRMEAPHE